MISPSQKRLLAIAAMVVALIAPANAQQQGPTQEELAKMITPESVAQLVARYASYGVICG
jgi:hypothetical protein